MAGMVSGVNLPVRLSRVMVAVLQGIVNLGLGDDAQQGSILVEQREGIEGMRTMVARDSAMVALVRKTDRGP